MKLPEEIHLGERPGTDGVRYYFGEATRQPNGAYQCLANVGGVLCIVEVTFTEYVLRCECLGTDGKGCPQAATHTIHAGTGPATVYRYCRPCATLRSIEALSMVTGEIEVLRRAGEQLSCESAHEDPR